MGRILAGVYTILTLVAGLRAQTQAKSPPAQKRSIVSSSINSFYAYLSMAGANKAADFRPMTQRERNQLYLRSMVNPWMCFKAATSAGVDQWNGKPAEWGQGASGYGKRAGNILGQYGIQRTVTFGLSSALHEDNRYFGSGRKGFGQRAKYALASSVLARHDDGRRSLSVSQLTGFAAGAFLSRLWQPASTKSAGDGAVSFGISMGWNTGLTVLKEFLPDIFRPLLKKVNGNQDGGTPAAPDPQMPRDRSTSPIAVTESTSGYGSRTSLSFSHDTEAVGVPPEALAGIAALSHVSNSQVTAPAAALYVGSVVR